MKSTRVPCVFAPQCDATYAYAWRMRDHVKKKHTTGQFKCPTCPDLRLFVDAKALKRHAKTHLRPMPCSKCGSPFKVSYLPRHEKTCRAPDVSVLPVKPSAQPFPPEPIFRPPTTALVRSPHRAPSSALLQDKLPEFVAWIRRAYNPAKKTRTRKPDDFLNKFRTLVGKWASCYGRSSSDFLEDLKKPGKCIALLDSRGITTMIASITKASDNRELKHSTIYNYIHPLLQFVDWHIDESKARGLHTARNAIAMMCCEASDNKKRERNHAQVQAKFATIPGLVELVTFIESDLRIKMLSTRADANASVWEKYLATRDYILPLLLLTIPPQRKQILNTIDVSEWKVVNGTGVFSVHEHKTSYLYGSVNLIIPAHSVVDVNAYLAIRARIAAPTVSSLFVNNRGQPDRYINNRFQAVMAAKFDCTISIKDCRNIFVNHASRHMDPAQLLALAHQMAHSFAVQQLIYRTDQSLERSMIATEQAESLPAFAKRARRS